MSCDYAPEQLYLYLDGELAPSEAQEVARHLTTCAECQQAVAAHQRLQAILRQTLEEEDVPAQLWRDIQQRLSQEATPVAQTSCRLPRRRMIWLSGTVVATLLLLAAATGKLAQAYGLRHGTLFLVGASFGIVLYHTGFGFTSAFRALMTTGDGCGLCAQMLMLALATLLFVPLLARGANIGGAIAPLSLSVLIGAVVFAIGMQLGGCLSAAVIRCRRRRLGSRPDLAVSREVANSLGSSQVQTTRAS
jgi:mycothiol system anti-sigma-R factor